MRRQDQRLAHDLQAAIDAVQESWHRLDELRVKPLTDYVHPDPHKNDDALDEAAQRKRQELTTLAARHNQAVVNLGLLRTRIGA